MRLKLRVRYTQDGKAKVWLIALHGGLGKGKIVTEEELSYGIVSKATGEEAAQVAKGGYLMAVEEEQEKI